MNLYIVVADTFNFDYVNAFQNFGLNMKNYEKHECVNNSFFFYL